MNEVAAKGDLDEMTLASPVNTRLKMTIPFNGRRFIDGGFDVPVPT